ncbi:MAG: hypothetical protein NC251_03325 [Lachnoclostridium sp.]|nr:hypothetical protein [Lachnospira sp.]MCM1247443.1 hypothetical protein [Lachnoclostridium sp.]MCM1536249.1 hypothetical protein [Clostridium sp.]
MKKQKILIYISLALALFVVAMESSTVYAASLKRIPDTSTRVYVGSTLVELEVGCNNSSYAYATVSADDDVDATMQLVVYYDGNKEHVTVNGGFSQRTYGDIGYQCSSRISMVECYFTVSSADGSITSFPLVVENP